MFTRKSCNHIFFKSVFDQRSTVCVRLRLTYWSNLESRGMLWPSCCPVSCCRAIFRPNTSVNGPVVVVLYWFHAVLIRMFLFDCHLLMYHVIFFSYYNPYIRSLEIRAWNRVRRQPRNFPVFPGDRSDLIPMTDRSVTYVSYSMNVPCNINEVIRMIMLRTDADDVLVRYPYNNNGPWVYFLAVHTLMRHVVRAFDIGLLTVPMVGSMAPYIAAWQYVPYGDVSTGAWVRPQMAARAVPNANDDDDEVTFPPADVQFPPVAPPSSPEPESEDSPSCSWTDQSVLITAPRHGSDPSLSRTDVHDPFTELQ